MNGKPQTTERIIYSVLVGFVTFALIGNALSDFGYDGSAFVVVGVVAGWVLREVWLT